MIISFLSSPTLKCISRNISAIKFIQAIAKFVCDVIGDRWLVLFLEGQSLIMRDR